MRVETDSSDKDILRWRTFLNKALNIFNKCRLLKKDPAPKVVIEPVHIREFSSSKPGAGDEPSYLMSFRVP
jgi:hypothetical protein